MRKLRGSLIAVERDPSLRFQVELRLYRKFEQRLQLAEFYFLILRERERDHVALFFGQLCPGSAGLANF